MAQGVGLAVVPGELARCAEEVARDLVALETDLDGDRMVRREVVITFFC